MKEKVVAAFLSYSNWIMKVVTIVTINAAAVSITNLNFMHLFYSGTVEVVG
jgi:hypothetical protein